MKEKKRGWRLKERRACTVIFSFLRVRGKDRTAEDHRESDSWMVVVVVMSGRCARQALE